MARKKKKQKRKQKKLKKAAKVAKALKGKKKTGKKAAKKGKVFRAILSGERAVSSSPRAVMLYNQSRFGEVIKSKVFYSLVESLYLLEKGKLNVYLGKKKLNFNSFMQEAREKEKNFSTRYYVYSDLRNRGYIIKTALKFGADFRVYAKGVKPGEDHAMWIVYPVYETGSLTWHEFAAKNRVAHSTRKRLLIGVVDEEGDVTYYEIEWKRP